MIAGVREPFHQAITEAPLLAQDSPIRLPGWCGGDDFPMLAPQLGDAQFIVEPMSESELRQAIIGPAVAAGLELDRSLPDVVVSDLRMKRARSSAIAGPDGAGVLPLLSEAMKQTWRKREGNRLTTVGYEAAGGVSHALSNHADETYLALTPSRQAIARELLLRMTTAGPDGEYADVDAVLDTLATARLVILDQHSASISHDVLLQAWPRLHGWLERDRGIVILHGQLAEDATAWHVRAFRPVGPVISASRTSLSVVSFGPGGTLLATASEKGTARLWRVSTQREVGGPIVADRKGLYALAFSPVAQTLATGGQDGAIRFWDAITHQQIGSLMAVDRKSVTDLAFSPTGKCWSPSGLTPLCSCGTWPPTASSPRSAGPTSTPRWRSARTAGWWPRATVAARCGCGTSRPPVRWASRCLASPRQ